MDTKQRVEEILQKKTEEVTQEEIDFVYANINFQTLLDEAMAKIASGGEINIDDDTIKSHIKE
jgi:hypothetical protein